MKTDFYTKALLTLITLFLGVIAFDKVYDTAIPETQAQEERVPSWKCKSLDYKKLGWDKVKDKTSYGSESLTNLTITTTDTHFIYCGSTGNVNPIEVKVAR